MVESDEVNIEYMLGCSSIGGSERVAESDMKQSKSKNELVPRFRIIKPMSSWEV